MGISLDELQLAARNHGMPLEALRYDVTPVGLHYLLVHFDVPSVPADWRLEVGGRVERPLSLSLDELRARPTVRRIVTMECAGNGRARLEPHVVSQPWLAEAVGTGEWGGVELAPLLEEAGVAGRRRSRCCSARSTAESTAASSRRTSAASRSPRRSRATRCSRTS